MGDSLLQQLVSRLVGCWQQQMVLRLPKAAAGVAKQIMK
jgi:hypothetical protein